MTISNEVVEAAARSFAGYTPEDEADNLERQINSACRSTARRILEAAAPYIQAEALEDAADDCYGDVMGQATATWLRYRASRLRQL